MLQSDVGYWFESAGLGEKLAESVVLRGGRHSGQLLRAAEAAEALDAALMQEGTMQHVHMVAALILHITALLLADLAIRWSYRVGIPAGLPVQSWCHQSGNTLFHIGYELCVKSTKAVPSCSSVTAFKDVCGVYTGVAYSLQASYSAPAWP